MNVLEELMDLKLVNCWKFFELFFWLVTSHQCKENERTMQQIYNKIYYTQYSFIYHKGQIRRNAIYVATLIIMLGLNVFFLCSH